MHHAVGRIGHPRSIAAPGGPARTGHRDAPGLASAAVNATPDDHRDAAAIATEAGQRLVALRATLHAAGADPTELRAEGDRSSHDFIVDALASSHPDDAVLSEEGADDPARLDASRVWIVDPLDGTRKFGEEGRTDWAVHV